MSEHKNGAQIAELDAMNRTVESDANFYTEGLNGLEGISPEAIALESAAEEDGE